MNDKVAQEIDDERRQQDAQWGGPDHDDKHSIVDWMDFIGQQIERFATTLMKRGESYYETPDARQRIVKIGALAAACLESMNRKAERER